MLNDKLEIRLRSHGFFVRIKNEKHKEICEYFASTLIQYGLKYDYKTRKNIRVPKALYASISNEATVYAFHRSNYIGFLSIVKLKLLGIPSPYLGAEDRTLDNFVDIIEEDYGDPLDVEYEIYPQWKLYPEQQEAVDHSLAQTRFKTSVIGLPPGGGKTVTMLFLAAQAKSRFILVVKPQYIERWLQAFEETFSNVKTKNILVIRGMESLKSMFLLQSEGKLDHVSVIIISNTTMRMFIKEYETYGDDMLNVGWPCLPQDYVKQLRGKFVYIDEAHQDFHFNYKLSIYTHAQLMVMATGTLRSDDPFIKKIIDKQYPGPCRFIRELKEGYIRATAVTYRFKKPEFIRCITNQGYSHIEFEKSVMKNVPTREAYYKLIKGLVDEGYVASKKEGYKCIIFVSTIQMATELTDYLSFAYGDFDVRRYCEDDDFVNLMEPDIRVTTIISAGTAIDIDKLSCNIMTQNLSSSASNLQVIGRLRKMKDGYLPRYYWLCCLDIPKHIEYSKKRALVVQPKICSLQYHNTNLYL